MLIGCIADDLTGATDLGVTLAREGFAVIQANDVPGPELALPRRRRGRRRAQVAHDPGRRCGCEVACGPAVAARARRPAHLLQVLLHVRFDACGQHRARGKRAARRARRHAHGRHAGLSAQCAHGLSRAPLRRRRAAVRIGDARPSADADARCQSRARAAAAGRRPRRARELSRRRARARCDRDCAARPAQRRHALRHPRRHARRASRRARRSLPRHAAHHRWRRSRDGPRARVAQRGARRECGARIVAGRGSRLRPCSPEAAPSPRARRLRPRAAPWRRYASIRLRCNPRRHSRSCAMRPSPPCKRMRACWCTPRPSRTSSRGSMLRSGASAQPRSSRTRSATWPERLPPPACARSWWPVARPPARWSKRFGVRALAIGQEIDPGVPWTTAVGGEPYRLALKSGNFGAPDFFARALAMVGIDDGAAACATPSWSTAARSTIAVMPTAAPAT